MDSFTEAELSLLLKKADDLVKNEKPREAVEILAKGYKICQNMVIANKMFQLRDTSDKLTLPILLSACSKFGNDKDLCISIAYIYLESHDLQQAFYWFSLPFMTSTSEKYLFLIRARTIATESYNSKDYDTAYIEFKSFYEMTQKSPLQTSSGFYIKNTWHGCEYKFMMSYVFSKLPDLHIGSSYYYKLQSNNYDRFLKIYGCNDPFFYIIENDDDIVIGKDVSVEEYINSDPQGFLNYVIFADHFYLSPYLLMKLELMHYSNFDQALVMAISKVQSQYLSEHVREVWWAIFNGADLSAPEPEYDFGDFNYYADPEGSYCNACHERPCRCSDPY